MERVYLPSEKALGLDMPQVKYNTRRGTEGYVEVSDADAALIRAHTGLQVGQMFAAPNASGLVCSGCGFEQFAAMAGDKCTKCGAPWTITHSDPPVQAEGRRVKVYDI